MNVNQINSTSTSPHNKRDVNSEYTYEDDGFFSDVPVSGSLSKSLFALNKYVKKNLLYEDNESDNDGAYFSKESTPNKCENKYNSDSVQSSDSGEKEEVVKASLNNPYIDAKQITEPIKETPAAKVINTNNGVMITPINENKPEPINNIPYATEQTDDYKFKQLHDNPNSSVKKSVVRIEYTDNRNEQNNLQAEHKSASLDDFTVDYGTAIDSDNGTSENVVLRDKKHVTIKENRHTVHDASDWVNRTDMYPDVYAPLPYSKFISTY